MQTLKPENQREAAQVVAIGAFALITRAALMERVAGGCVAPKGLVCGCGHGEVYECANDVFLGGLYLGKLGARQRPRELVEVVGRYLGLMELMDLSEKDVRGITQMVREAREARAGCCDYCGGAGKEGGGLLQCGRCQRAHYCTKECQVGAWKKARAGQVAELPHKAYCMR
jgi:hypothetical protein